MHDRSAPGEKRQERNCKCALQVISHVNLQGRVIEPSRAPPGPGQAGPFPAEDQVARRSRINLREHTHRGCLRPLDTRLSAVPWAASPALDGPE